jgi:hypothetical protein
LLYPQGGALRRLPWASMRRLMSRGKRGCLSIFFYLLARSRRCGSCGKPWRLSKQLWESRLLAFSIAAAASTARWSLSASCHGFLSCSSAGPDVLLLLGLLAGALQPMGTDLRLQSASASVSCCPFARLPFALEVIPQGDGCRRVSDSVRRCNLHCDFPDGSTQGSQSPGQGSGSAETVGRLGLSFRSRPDFLSKNVPRGHR